MVDEFAQWLDKPDIGKIWALQKLRALRPVFIHNVTMGMSV
jgi:hypothetical protein